jgi:predicted nucleotidyltransferase
MADARNTARVPDGDRASLPKHFVKREIVAARLLRVHGSGDRGGGGCTVSDRIQALLARLKTDLEALYGERLRGLYLYGSYARGEEDAESDVDVLVVLDEVGDYAAEIDRTSEIVSRTSLAYGASVSRVFVPLSDWLSAETNFLANVRAEAIAA